MRSLSCLFVWGLFFFLAPAALAQTSAQKRPNNANWYAGIEVGSKGVKMTVLEMGRNAKSTGVMKLVKDTTINTDFISFSDPSFSATLNGLHALYLRATEEFRISPRKVFTVISSGVKMQAEKEKKENQISRLIDSFRVRVQDPSRQVEVVDVAQEARLSHLGIIPDSRRYTTFLLDIGSGNSKGGFFPFDNLRDFRLFQINWGTKSTANAAEKRLEGDNSLANYHRQLTRVLAIAENSEIIYAVNASGAYSLSDNIAVSGGIAWAVSTLTHPELIDNPVVNVTYREVEKFAEKLLRNPEALTADFLTGNINRAEEKERARKEISRVHQVFDQRALLAGTGLLLKIMRQFESVFEAKHFYLLKNGQVGWISAYVDQAVD